MKAGREISHALAVSMVKDAIAKCGNQTKFAQLAGISQGHLSQMLHGKARLTPTVLVPAGVRIVVRYELIKGMR